MADANRNLLFGLLALQNGLIDEARLVAAVQAWTRDKARPLSEHLVALGDLDAEQRAGVETMVALHLRKHGGDLDQSLASIATDPSTRERLDGIADPDLEATMSHLGSSAATAAVAETGGAARDAAGRPTGDARRFRVLRPHAQGGLGAVFLAMDEQLHREVALKHILSSHADNPASRQRFLLEAEVTGGLEHPGIVPVYGLGIYPDGRPYYAMRFIHGDSLKAVIERFHTDGSYKRDPGRRSLELRKLLRQFLDVCNAIEYAHARGVLHRDIKPANVIVGRHGQTLVVDWGLAKVLGRTDAVLSDERPLVTSATSGSVETLAGSTLGTPSFMSPEQARGDLEHLGPQSDVYSLGATLYFLLTGRTPVERDDVRVLLRAVQQGEFAPPRLHDPSLDQALEAICLKAIAQKPEGRYSSAAALAEDVERWMADEPVAAWHEPLARRARRWARRHRTAVAAAAMAMLAGVVGLAAVATIQTRANEVTRRALDDTRRAQGETQAALRQSEESRKQAEAVGAFLVQAFRSPDPSKDGRQVKVVQLLDEASQRLDKEFRGSQATRGTLLDTLGRTYGGLGMFDRAIALHIKARSILESALGLDHRLTLACRSHLANGYMSAGRTQDAIALHESTLKLFESKLGPDDPETLQCRNDLAVDYWFAGRNDRAIAMHEETLKRREATLGLEHPDTLQSRQNLAIAYSTGRMSAGIAMFKEVLRLQEKSQGPTHPFTLETRNELASAYRDAGRIREATALDEETLKLREARLGPDHRDTISSRANLALDYSASGRLAEAIVLQEGTLKLREASLGPDHPDTLIGRINLADTYRDAGRSDEAIALNEPTLKRLKTTLGPDHPYTLICASNLAASYLQRGRLADAISLLQKTLKTCEAKLGAADTVTLWDRGNLATAYELLDRWTVAEGLLRESLARRRKVEKPDSPLVAGDLAQLGRNLLAQSRWMEAEPLLRDSLTISEKSAADDWKRYDAMSLLGGSLSGQGHYAEAEPLLVGGYEGMKERESRIVALDKFRLREAAARVVRLYDGWGKPEKVAEWKAKLGAHDLSAPVRSP